jgi:exonuclease III
MMYEHKADVAIISEPNKIPDNDIWYGSTDDSCCLLLLKDVEVMNSGLGEGYVWVDFLSCRVYSCYFSPSNKHSLIDYWAYLSNLSDCIHQGPREVIVAGDFNAHSLSWGSPSMYAKSDLQTWRTRSGSVINQGRAPTFERRGQESHIIVTFASSSVSRKIQDWRVLDEDIASDHHPIFFSTQMIVQPTNTQK